MSSSNSSSSSSSTSSEESSNDAIVKRKRQRDVEDAHSDSEQLSELDDQEDGQDVEIAALSHAAKRRQKKRQRLLGKVPENEDVKETNGNALSKRRQNSVWVGNLSYKTTSNALKTFLEEAGEITRVHMPTKAGADTGTGMRGENRGFAYVDFATPDAKIVAISMSEKNLDGRKLLIKDGKDFAGRPEPSGTTQETKSTSSGVGTGMSKTAQRILRAQKRPPAPTLFLGNLGFEATEQSIRGLFEAHKPRAKKKDGEEQVDMVEQSVGIRKVRMGTFEDSGACKGFAFVDFTKTENATAALINPRNHHLDGRNLVVEYASAEAVRRGGGGPPRIKCERLHRHNQGNVTDRVERPRQGRPLRKEGGQEAGTPPVVKATSSPQNLKNYNQVERANSSSVQRGREDGSRNPRHRAKPGAALAVARREKVAIVPSEGQRLVFT